MAQAPTLPELRSVCAAAFDTIRFVGPDFEWIALGSEGELSLRELTADLFISLDGFASGVDEAPFFGYFGEELERWVGEHLDRDQI